MSLSSQTSVPILIKWLPPPTGKIKLNTDGSARGDPGEGGFGGVFRDETGIWLSGFFGKLDSCSSLEAEMWGLYRGLTIVLEKGLHEVIVETDSSLAENLLTEGPLQNCSFRSIVEDSRHLIRRCNCTIHSIRREGNKCADMLAKMGSNQMDQLVVMEEPPAEVRSQLVADMIGTAYRRMRNKVSGTEVAAAVFDRNLSERRPLPKRGQIKMRIASKVFHGIASVLSLAPSRHSGATATLLESPVSKKQSPV